MIIDMPDTDLELDIETSRRIVLRASGGDSYYARFIFEQNELLPVAIALLRAFLKTQGESNEPIRD